MLGTKARSSPWVTGTYRSCDFDQGHHGQGRRQLWDVDGHAMTRDTMDEEGDRCGVQMVGHVMTRDTMDKEGGSYECRWSYHESLHI